MKLPYSLQRICDLHRPNKYALKPFIIDDGKEHPFAVICPGGGYSDVCSFCEGIPFAEELNKLGYHAFVVYYRVKKKGRYPEAHNDLQRAIEYIFAHKNEWRLDTDNWSIWGSSAGGHLVASYCTEKRPTANPSAVVLVYPVITMGEYTHKGSRNNLLGVNADEAMINKLSAEKQVTSDYPPAYLWYGKDDDCVPPVNSHMLADALAEVGVPCKLEKYEGIGHGAGLAKGTNAEKWFYNAVDFWQEQAKGK